MTQALFTDEGPEYYQAAYAHNRAFATGGPYRTPLTDEQEAAFRGWVAANHVNFDPNETVSDYDMRGYWLALQSGEAEQPGTEPGGGIGFPDTYKTPYDTTFSRESKYATPDNPFVWSGDQLIDMRSGEVIFARGGTTQPLTPWDMPTASSAARTSAPAHPSGYGTRWRMGIQHADGRITPLPLTMRSTGDGHTHWDAQTPPLHPGDRIVVIG